MLNRIKIKLLDTNTQILSHKLGYSNVKIFNTAKEKFLQTPSLSEWLRAGHYDLTHNSKDFYTKLLEIFELDDDGLLERAESINDELKRFENSCVHVVTDFKRKGESVYSLMALEKLKVIEIPVEELLFKSDEEIFSEVSKLIQTHFIESGGKLEVFGKINSYIFHFEGESHFFGVDGQRVYKNI